MSTFVDEMIEMDQSKNSVTSWTLFPVYQLVAHFWASEKVDANGYESNQLFSRGTTQYMLHILIQIYGNLVTAIRALPYTSYGHKSKVHSFI